MKLLNIKHTQLELQLSSAFLSPERREKSVRSFWQRKMMQNISLFNGTSIMLNGSPFKKEEDCLTIYVFVSDFSDYLYNEQLENGTRNVFTSSVLLTSDNFLVFGRQNTTSSHPSEIHFIGGSFDEQDILLETVDFESAIKREILEELPIRKGNIETCEQWIVAITDSGRTNIVYHTTLNVTSEELKKNFVVSRENEFSELIFLKNTQKAIVEFMFSDDKFSEYIKPIIGQFQKDVLMNTIQKKED